MDVDTLIDALSADEREELLKRLTTSADDPDNETDESVATRGCCGGHRGRGSMARRRAMMREMHQMCCAG